MIKDTSCTIELNQIIPFKYVFRNYGSKMELKKLPRGPTIKIRKKLKIDKNFAWATGFYLAEGSKMDSTIGIANSSVPLLLRFKNFLEDVFDLNDVKWIVVIRTRNATVGKSKYFKTLFAAKNVYLYDTKLAATDNIEIRINNSALTKIFHSLITNSLEIIQKDKNLSLEFLKGYEVGDGSINVRNGCLHDINITVKNPYIKNLIKKMFYDLYKINLRERKSKGVYEILYSRVKGITNLILDQHFKDYDRQWTKLIKAYRNKEYVRSHLRYWKLINRPLSVNSIMEKADRSHWSVRDALNADEKIGLVESSGKKLNWSGHTYKFYNLTRKGKELVKILSR